MSTYRTYAPVLSRTCGSCGLSAGRWQCSTCALVVCTGCDHACTPKTDDEAATPPASPVSAPAPTGGETAAECATAALTAGPVSSSSATGGRVTSEVATLPPVPQRRGGETDGEGVGLDHPAVTEWQQGLGTCSPGATGSPEVTP